MRPEWEGIQIYHKDPTYGGRARIVTLHNLIVDLIGAGILPDNFRFLEVGVFQGDVAEHLLASFPFMSYTGIDAWKTQDEEVYKDTANSADVLRKAKDLSYNRTNRFRGRCKFVEGFSPQILDTMPDGYFHMAYIDANHSKDAVRADIIAVMTKLIPHGVITGHDYCPGWETVIEGVNSAASLFGMSVESFWPESSVWMFV